MKKTSLIIASLLLLSGVIFYSCTKENSTNTGSSIIKKKTTKNNDEEKFRAILNDIDWHTIVEINTEVFANLIASNYDITTYTEENKDKFLTAIKMSNEEYLTKALKVKTASARLIYKYNIEIENYGCIECNKPLQESLNTLNSRLEYFRKYPTELSYFRDYMMCRGGSANGNYSSASASARSGFGCGLGYIACCVVCGTLAEIPPLFVICCYACLCGCENPPPGC